MAMKLINVHWMEGGVTPKSCTDIDTNVCAKMILVRHREVWSLDIFNAWFADSEIWTHGGNMESSGQRHDLGVRFEGALGSNVPVQQSPAYSGGWTASSVGKAESRGHIRLPPHPT